MGRRDRHLIPPFFYKWGHLYTVREPFLCCITSCTGRKGILFANHSMFYKPIDVHLFRYMIFEANSEFVEEQWLHLV